MLSPQTEPRVTEKWGKHLPVRRTQPTPPKGKSLGNSTPQDLKRREIHYPRDQLLPHSPLETSMCPPVKGPLMLRIPDPCEPEVGAPGQQGLHRRIYLFPVHLIQPSQVHEYAIGDRPCLLRSLWHSWRYSQAWSLSFLRLAPVYKIPRHPTHHPGLVLLKCHQFALPCGLYTRGVT